jgi:hypothetical protein
MQFGWFRLPGMRVFVINDLAWVERMLITEAHNHPCDGCTCRRGGSTAQDNNRLPSFASF